MTSITKLGKMERAVEFFYRSSDETITIINGDFLKVSSIQEETIDLIVTSPSYNIDVKYESYDDSLPYEKYLEFTEKWLTKALKLVKPHGRLCLNIPLDKSKGRTEERF